MESQSFREENKHISKLHKFAQMHSRGWDAVLHLRVFHFTINTTSVPKPILQRLLLELEGIITLCHRRKESLERWKHLPKPKICTYLLSLPSSCVASLSPTSLWKKKKDFFLTFKSWWKYLFNSLYWGQISCSALNL